MADTHLSQLANVTASLLKRLRCARPEHLLGLGASLSFLSRCLLLFHQGKHSWQPVPYRRTGRGIPTSGLAAAKNIPQTPALKARSHLPWAPHRHPGQPSAMAVAAGKQGNSGRQYHEHRTSRWAPKTERGVQLPLVLKPIKKQGVERDACFISEAASNQRGGEFLSKGQLLTLTIRVGGEGATCRNRQSALGVF